MKAQRTPWLLLLLLLALAATGLGLVLHTGYAQQSQHIAQKHAMALGVAYRSSINMHRLDVSTRFENQIMRPEVLDLLERANRATADELPLLRGWLYRSLHAEYRRMQDSGLRQLHFHFPDGRSLLRFHSPTQVGDPSLFDIRPAIRIANTELRPASGFEGGRVLPGFRYVFPIVNRSGVHLGSVELSLPFEAMHQNLLDLMPGSDFGLLLHRDVVALVFEDMRGHFVPAPLHADYFKEHPLVSEVSRDFVESERVRRLDARLHQDAAVQAQMGAGQSFAVPVLDGGQGYIAAFHAITDVQGRHMAYVVGYSAAPALLVLRKALWRDALVGATLLLLLAFLAGLLLRQRQRAAAEAARLHTITATMGDGLYVVDRQRRTVFVNRAACTLTGYTQAELMGGSIHDLLHRHCGNHFMPETDCPIHQAAASGTAYDGEELFRHHGGRIFAVEVSTRPLLDKYGPAGAVTLFRDISERRRMQEELQRLATTDPLTGIANRRHFMQRLAEELERMRRHGGSAALLMFDLDHFKRVNDSYGHATGDAVLRHCVAVVQQRLRRGDTFGRLGGEEFGLLLPHTDLPAAYELADKLRAQIAATPCPGPQGPIEFTVSIGVAPVTQDSQEVSAILAQVDHALYRAKDAGRNRVVVAQ